MIKKLLVALVLWLPSSVFAENLDFYRANCFHTKNLDYLGKIIPSPVRELIPDENNTCIIKEEKIKDTGNFDLYFLKYSREHQEKLPTGEDYKVGTETVAIIKADGEVILADNTNIVTALYKTPVIVYNKYGKFLMIKVVFSGTGAFMQYFLFKLEEDKIIPVDTSSLLDTHLMDGITLPEGKTIFGRFRGPFMNFEKMELSAPVWEQDRDTVVGKLNIKYKYSNEKISMDEYTYDPIVKN